MTARRPLRPPPERPRTSIPLADLVELDRRQLRHNLTAVLYTWPPRKRTERRKTE